MNFPSSFVGNYAYNIYASMSLQTSWCILCSLVLLVITCHRINLFWASFYLLPCKAGSHPQDPQGHTLNYYFVSGSSKHCSRKAFARKRGYSQQQELMDVVPGSDNLWKVLEDLLSEEMIRTLCKKLL